MLRDTDVLLTKILNLSLFVFTIKEPFIYQVWRTISSDKSALWFTFIFFCETNIFSCQYLVLQITAVMFTLHASSALLE